MTRRSGKLAMVLASLLVTACSDAERDGATDKAAPENSHGSGADDAEANDPDGSSAGGGQEQETQRGADAPDGGGAEVQPDADIADAGKDSGADRCYSPLHLPTPFESGRLGCACAELEGQQRAYCIVEQDTAWALVCDQGHWRHVIDGPCFPSPANDRSWCASGVRTTEKSCPSGFHQWSLSLGVDAGSEGHVCCHPLEVSETECAEAGFRVVAAGTQGSLLGTRCSDGGKLRAFVPGATASLCCE